MADSPSHKLGQIIGDAIESALADPLQQLCATHQLYLDQRGPRPARGKRKKVSWTDRYGNKHDLDFVIERGGSAGAVGTPTAFVEVAWRRYTKHSRNKAQEIRGALIPLAETFGDALPFLGAVLAGVFTDGALDQLRSRGFAVLHLPYADVVKAFSQQNLDIRFDEQTPTATLQALVAACTADPGKVTAAADALLTNLQAEVDTFMKSLEATLTRTVTQVEVTPLLGRSVAFPDPQAAQQAPLDDLQDPLTPRGFDVTVTFSNGQQLVRRLPTRGQVDALLAALP
ncbi:MAG: DNA methylase [Alphaproteobacteria bacterium]|nr:DNA methylase [Alphaproteobacteria bacterium]